MKLEDVLALIRAGYTREEISAFEASAPSVPENKPTPVQNDLLAPEYKPTPVQNDLLAPEYKPTPVQNDLMAPEYKPTQVQNDLMAPEYKPTPVSNAQPAPDATTAPADLKTIIAQAVKEAMQAQAIATSNQPNTSTQTAEECLAAMLR